MARWILALALALSMVGATGAQSAVCSDPAYTAWDAQRVTLMDNWLNAPPARTIAAMDRVAYHFTDGAAFAGSRCDAVRAGYLSSLTAYLLAHEYGVLVAFEMDWMYGAQMELIETVGQTLARAERVDW